MTFSEETVADLKKKLSPDAISTRKQSGQTLSYLEGWFVEDTANQIFGFDGWSSEVISLEENTAPTTNRNGNHVVSFRAKVRLVVGAVIREGIGFGSGISKDIHDAYEAAIKEAETDAEKRAFKKFGNRFGLALYDKARANVGHDDNDTPRPVNNNTDWGFERDELTRMVNNCANLEDFHELWKTPRMQDFLKSAPVEFSSPVIRMKDQKKAGNQ